MVEGAEAAAAAYNFHVECAAELERIEGKTIVLGRACRASKPRPRRPCQRPPESGPPPPTRDQRMQRPIYITTVAISSFKSISVM